MSLPWGFPPASSSSSEGSNSVFFTGLVPLTTIRLALSDFTGVDLTDIRDIAS